LDEFAAQIKADFDRHPQLHDFIKVHETVHKDSDGTVTYTCKVTITLLPDAMRHHKQEPGSEPASYTRDDFDPKAWGHSRMVVVSVFRVYRGGNVQQEVNGLGLRGPAPPEPAKGADGYLVPNTSAADALRLAVARAKAIAAIKWQLQYERYPLLDSLIEGLQLRALLHLPPPGSSQVASGVNAARLG
jgi:hypothetical protein